MVEMSITTDEQFPRYHSKPLTPHLETTIGLLDVHPLSLMQSSSDHTRRHDTFQYSEHFVPERKTLR